MSMKVWVDATYYSTNDESTDPQYFLQTLYISSHCYKWWPKCMQALKERFFPTVSCIDISMHSFSMSPSLFCFSEGQI